MTKAWIELVITPIGGRCYRIVEEGVLHPGTRNPYARKWMSVRSAREFCKREGLDIQDGPCPLPSASQFDRTSEISAASGA